MSSAADKLTKIYIQFRIYMSSLEEGMGMSRSTLDFEPVIDGEEYGLDVDEDQETPSVDVSDLFRLTGGVATSSARTANRIDDLLTKMLEHTSSCRYLDDADRNLDYLLTHLKLDLIERIARDVASREDDVQEEPPEQILSLDRVRPSL